MLYFKACDCRKRNGPSCSNYRQVQLQQAGPCVETHLRQEFPGHNLQITQSIFTGINLHTCITAEMSSKQPPRPGTGSYRSVQPAAKHSAAQSHVANDKYMEDFERAYESMQALTTNPNSPYAMLEDPGFDGNFNRPRPNVSHTGTAAAAGSLASRSAHNNPTSTQPASYRSANARGIPGTLPSHYPPAVRAGWQTGPDVPEGVMCDLSDRPCTCSSAHWTRNEIAIGSTDHALYIVDAVKGTRKRTLYSKTCGHSEWVSCCTFLPDGQLVSGGMDSKLWIWPAGGVRGKEIHGHAGPISQVAFDESSGLIVSASYDKLIKLWDATGRECGMMAGHTAPILEMDISPDGLLVTGDRSGHVLLWDSGTGDNTWHMKNVHLGHVTALTWFDYEDGSCAGCFASGGQEGRVRVWDPRDHSCVSKQELHVNQQGRGAVSDVCAGGPAASGYLVSTGADCTLCISDPRRSFSLAHQIKLSDFPYSLAVAGGLALVGCGDGSLWVIHIATGLVRYCLGANKHAVRCLEACEDRLLACGDDGKSLLWHFH